MTNTSPSDKVALATFAARKSEPPGFTVIELATVLATIALLAALALPSFARTKEGNKAQRCLTNHKDLALAWSLYWSDSGGRLAVNPFPTYSATLPNEWCGGILDLNTNNSDNTNTLNLTGAQLGRYAGTVSIYRCPGDTSLYRREFARVRSTSMNAYMGPPSGVAWSPGYVGFIKISDISFHPVSQEFVFIDEHPNSINDAEFQIDMTGYDPIQPGAINLLDIPASHHDRAGSVAFADGHVELHEWQDARLLVPVSDTNLLKLGGLQTNSQDVAWLQDHASYKSINPTQ